MSRRSSSNHFVQLVLLAAVVGLPAHRSVFAGGRACACDELLKRLSGVAIPTELRPIHPTPEVVAAFDIGERGVTALKFLGDGETLVVAEAGPARRGDVAGRVLLYDLTGTEPRQTGSLDAGTDHAGSAAVSPKTGLWLATGSVRWDQRLSLFRKNDSGLQLVMSVPDFSDWWLRSLAFSPDERRLATVSGEPSGPVQLWEVSDEGLTNNLNLPGPTGPASAMSFSLDGRFLVAGTGSGHRKPGDGQLIMWDLSKDQPQVTFLTQPAPDKRKPADIMALAWHAVGENLVAGDQDGRVMFHHVTSDGRLEPLDEAVGHQRGVRSLECVDGQRTLSSGNDGALILWSAAGERLHQWRVGDSGVVLAVAPSGRHVAVGLANGVVYLMRLT
jgi:WD40 repeat protein